MLRALGCNPFSVEYTRKEAISGL